MMRYVLTALIAATAGALLALALSAPVPLAKRVKVSTATAVLDRKQAMVDCMTYMASTRIGLGVRDRAVDAACESLADDFVSTMPPPPEPEKPSDEVSL